MFCVQAQAEKLLIEGQSAIECKLQIDYSCCAYTTYCLLCNFSGRVESRSCQDRTRSGARITGTGNLFWCYISVLYSVNLGQMQTAEVAFQREQNELEIARAKELSAIEVSSFVPIVQLNAFVYIAGGKVQEGCGQYWQCYHHRNSSIWPTCTGIHYCVSKGAIHL